MNWILGGVGPDESPSVSAVILDDSGVIEVDLSYIAKHPSWYEYAGTYTVNSTTFHSYRLKG